MKPVVLIIGKPNVGKSTLFNRLIKEKKAIVMDYPGVTRDQIFSEARYDGRAFTLVDTCGIFEEPTNELEEIAKNKVMESLKESDLILFIVDGKNGLTAEDYYLANVLRKVKNKVLLVANKVESYEKFEINVLPELYKLGLGEPIPISSEHNKNLDELIENIFEKIPQYETEEEKDENIIKVALIGRANAGKSSLFNAITGINRAIVSDVPGTTRDSIDELVEINGQKYLFIDTAGLKRKSKTKYGSVEMYSTVRTIRAIENSDVVVLLIDAVEGITQQDKKVIGAAENRGKATVIAFNKWDLVKYHDKRIEEYLNLFEKELYFVNYSPVIFTSAAKHWGIEKLMDAIDTAYNSYTKRIPTSALNAALERFMMVSPPPIRKGKRIKIYYGTQVDIKPPVFIFFSNMPQQIPKTYQRAIQNMIRRYIDPFIGSPIFIKFKNRTK
ncbi:MULTISPECIES: ribosome biogenesis GTPase Der [unclassified Marinitoga]|uniref:ribosome biogenesis GTPase Der n=1 Tax=unclassified Marinitoga TaxID=2640159 RepID=UPI000640CB0C|nr:MULTISPECIES: ribosome biogenesis GTPase Der [unclassified Marinitoga]KLO24894.1 GTP-binding protein Der [Marinitoga sp. 1155]NUU99007.1 GTP-binding protein Der [Marinitoga sp. 1154]